MIIDCDIASSQPEIASACTRVFLHGVDAEFPDAKVIYNGTRNTLYVITPRNQPSKRLCVKHFRRTRFPNNFIYTTFRHSKARRSMEHALQLIKLGFLTPHPIGWCNRRRCIALRDAYYVCEYLPIDNIRGWAQRPDRDRFVEAFVAEMLRLHRAGVFFRDFSPGNILCQTMADGAYKFYYVDLNRMEFGVTDHRKLMRMFRSISLDEDEVALLARAYARTASLPEADVVADALAAVAAYKAKKRRLHRLKRLIGRSSS